MATATVYTTEGSLNQAFLEVAKRDNSNSSLSVETNLENILNYFMSVNNSAAYDYQAGGYLNYGLLPDGRFAIDLDGYTLTFEGNFSFAGSRVTSINIKDVSGGITVFEGEFNYQGLPFFSMLSDTAWLSYIGKHQPGGTEWFSMHVSAQVTPQLNISGQVNSVTESFLDSTGKVVEAGLSGGAVYFQTEGGHINVLPAGYFTSYMFDTVANPFTSSAGYADYLSVDNAYVPVVSVIKDVDLLSGNDYVSLTGSQGSLIYTSTGNDTIAGSFFSDTIYSESGNDLLIGKGGNDFLDGGAGLDTASYSGVRADYLVTSGFGAGAAMSIVRDLVGGRDGTDNLQNVERLDFSDKSLALDITGVAGQAYRLYKAAFDRTPDLEGLGFWLEQMDQGASLVGVAQGFISSAEFRQLYGANATNNEFVDRLYQNVLDRSPDQAGYDYWNSTLANGSSRADVLVSFSESSENIAKVEPMISGGIEYVPFIS